MFDYKMSKWVLKTQRKALNNVGNCYSHPPQILVKRSKKILLNGKIFQCFPLIMDFTVL